MTSVFVDSTVLLYPLDSRDPGKQAICAGWLKSLRDTDQLMLSPQVLNEGYWVAVRKPDFAPARPTIRAYLTRYMNWVNAPLDASCLSEAFQLIDRYGPQFWDALLIASANAANCTYFLSEDLNDGQIYGTVKVINPFRHTPADVLGPALQP